MVRVPPFLQRVLKKVLVREASYAWSHPRLNARPSISKRNMLEAPSPDEAGKFEIGIESGLSRSRRMFCLVLLLCETLLSPAQPPASMSPSDVEAAYLYNFGKFIRYPAVQGQDSSSFSICILGEDSFGGTLDSLVTNELIEGRRIVARRLTSVAAANNCQIVFIAASEETRLAKDLAVFEKKPVLTVSNLPGFLDHGGMIQFLLQNNRVRFAVNLKPAEQSGLSLSSELLKVAVRVDAKPASEAR
jgi:hypothetical protein